MESVDGIVIMFAVGDLNGNPTGYVDQIEFGDMETLTVEGEPLPFELVKEESKLKGTNQKLHIGSLAIPIISYRNWVGNWCWDAARVSYGVALALAEYLRSEGWNCTCAESSLYDTWHEGKPLTVDMLES